MGFHDISKKKSDKNNLNLKQHKILFSLSSRYSFTCHVNTISDLNKLCGVGSAECIYEYKSKRCERKIVFSVQCKVVCTAYKRIFDAKWQFILITICPVLFEKSPVAAV